MRFMILVKANEDSEAGVMPSETLLAEMGRYNEELVKAGIMLDGEGLHPSSKSARRRAHPQWPRAGAAAGSGGGLCAGIGAT